MATTPNNAPTDQVDSQGDASLGVPAVESPFGNLSWSDLQASSTQQRFASLENTRSDALNLHTVDFVQRPEQTLNANGTETPDSIAKSVANGLNPKPDAVGLYRIGEAIALANGMGRDTSGSFDKGTQIKVPEIDQDGKMTVSDGSKKYEIWTNGAYREHAIGDDTKGRGWDTLGKEGGREYTFEKQSDGTERRTYAGGASEVFSQDRLSGTGTTSRAEGSREYTFKINPDGSQTRTFTDNGDQHKINADGSSVYKHIDPNNPDQSFLRITDSTNKKAFEFDIPKEQSQKSLEDITRNLTINNLGDGKGDFLANAALLNQAISDAFSRGGDKAVQALAKEIQNRMQVQNPNADTVSFQLTAKGEGVYDVDRKVLKGAHTLHDYGGVRFDHKKFH